MKEARSIEKAVLTREAVLYGLRRPCSPSSCCSISPPPILFLAPRRDTHFAAGFSRGSFLLAIAVLLAFLVSALTNPAPARAADAVLLEGDITVGEDSGEYGYSELEFGSTSRAVFPFGDNTVNTVLWIVSESNGTLSVGIDVKGILPMNSDGNHGDNDLELHLGTRVFTLEDFGKNIGSLWYSPAENLHVTRSQEPTLAGLSAKRFPSGLSHPDSRRTRPLALP